MPVKIGRRPFTDCPMIWIMSNAGLTGLNDFSTGRGDVSNAQCSSLNVGEYPMTYKACGSDGNVLLWQGDCVERQIILPPPVSCVLADTTKKHCDVSVSVSIPSFAFSAQVMECPLTGYIWPQGRFLSGLECRTIYNEEKIQNDATLSVSIPATSLHLSSDAYLNDTFNRWYTVDGTGFSYVAADTIESHLRVNTSAGWGGCYESSSDVEGLSGLNHLPTLSSGTCARIQPIKNCEIRGHAKAFPFAPSLDSRANHRAVYIARLFDDADGPGNYVRLDVAIQRLIYGNTVGVFRDLFTFVGETYLYRTTENLFDYVTDDAECARTITATLVTAGDVYIRYTQFHQYDRQNEEQTEGSASNQFGVAPTTIELTATIISNRQLEPEYVGPDPGDRLKATWSLEYDIQEQLWTLHSFEQIENPIYTLRDTNPCCGNSKVLTRVQNIGAQGCDISPETITISRGGDFFGGEVQRRTNIRSGCPRTTKRAACDCQDNVIDYRAATVAKCVDITTPGCEDYGDDVKTRFPKNQLSCPSCARNSPCDPFLPEFVDVPCSYEALFGSGIGGKPPCDIIHDNTEIASGVVTMRLRCRFTNPCEWVAVGPSAEPLDGAVGHDPYCVLCAEFTVGSCASSCTWEAVQAGVCIPGSRPALLNPVINILKKLGTSWHLNVAGDATTLEYNHPSFGMITYRVDQMEPFLCDNINTLHLEAQGNLPDGVMPESICVRPRYSGCGGSMTYDIKSDDYAEVEDQIACCDPACGSIGPIPIKVRCCFNFEECSTTFTAQTTLLGRDSPAGPSYLGSCTLHGVLWTGVIYCDGVRWKTDWYCKSPREFFVTTTHTHTCCPLTLSVEYWPDNFGGVKCCPVQECKCCDTTGTDYDTLEMSITFSAACAADMFAALCTFSRPVTMTLTMTRVFNSTSSWQYILCDNDYGMDMFVSCLNGVWTFDWNFAGTPPFPLLIANCDNKQGQVTATNSALCPAILLEWTDPITCPNGNCVLVSNITITS